MTTFDAGSLRSAAALIAEGRLVAMPTETVYGLAADATNDTAVARIFEAKGRPQFNPLIVHVADAAMARRFVEWPPLAEKLASRFWPGPLTLVLKRRADCAVSLLASAGLDTLGVRAPAHPVAQALIREAGRPLAAPSANPSGAISPTTAAHVRESLGDKVDMILDGGPCPVGLESTIVKIDGDGAVLLRPGGVARAQIESVAGRKLGAPSQASAPQAPGMLASHYAPQTPLRLNARAPCDGEAYLGFGDAGSAGPLALNLSASASLQEAAANLFAYLRTLDKLCARRGLRAIAVAPIPSAGLGEAINDRLNRAAAPRGHSIRH